MEFKDLLKSKLNGDGVSQYEAAKIIGCKQSEISNYVAGKRRPGVTKLVEFASFLGLPIEVVVESIKAQEGGV
ncbi:hypothetical protein VCHA50P417_20459 [Vibrio chagasii]|uniref:helix-turn-helix domain-containing protein n=1 Tax=Vibrio TaxID=662 RepID=UPI0010527B9B|nr:MULTISPECIES: helix-turn-helix transcriptional regulator [Vibrio]CAH6850084.1 hypothetical protein VCHA34P121_10456 [Vibrio chagasii]TCT44327.1 helix-turn-helix protein [Vibrio crassostreae]TKF63451.1 helix-turn-helix transcriptional regulator [Vibrio sp. F13]CAH6861522.1 hypothetical protein VCHA28FP16_10795 [Vibrio chagasii]CAH6924840.1 hypothetical protein VCHA48P437_100111 [Vibrio chagasii]